MKKYSQQTTYYISIENNKDIGCQLFNIAYLINILNKSNLNDIKRKIVFRKGNSIYSDSIFNGLFSVLDDDKYDKIGFEKMSINEIDIRELCRTAKNIEICDTDIYEATENTTMTFKYINNSIKKQILNLVYSNEDLMYSAYYIYRDILDFYGDNTKDDDIVAIHILKSFNNDYDYYYNALSIMNNLKIKNIAVITDDIVWAKIILNDINDTSSYPLTYSFYFVSNVEKNNYETMFILMSMFKNIIVSNNPTSMDSLWASYISNYDNKNIISADKNIIHKYITAIL